MSNDASTRPECPHATETVPFYLTQVHMKSINRPEQDVNRCLSRDLGNKVSPSFGKRTIPKRNPVPARSKDSEIVTALYLKRDIEHVRSRWRQLHINFEAAVLDRALHDNLHNMRAA